MPWLDTYGDANKIIDGETTLENKYYGPLSAMPEDGDVIGTRRIDTTTQYRHVGMDYATAVTCRDAINDPSSNIIAQLERENAAGAYAVRVTQTVEGEYEDIIYSEPT